MIINLITYNNSTNYGALLQCLCLKDLIEKNFNCLVKLNRYHPSKLVYAEKYRPLITKNFNKFLGTAKKNLNVYFWKKYAFKNQFYEDGEDNKDSVLSIYGSDEIWNFKNAYHGYDPYFFGANDEKKKISYAASIGRSTYSSLPSNIKFEILNNLEKFENISVRDQNTSEFIYKLINKEPQIVLDPTLIYTPKILENQNFISRYIENDYAIIYGTVFSQHQQTLIKNYCNKRKLKMISVGYNNNWLEHNHLDLNPTTFYNYIKNSKVVFTSMFHGVMFSTKLARQFYYTIDPIRKNKIESFLDTFNLHNREIKDNIPENDINYDDLSKRIDIMALDSKNFLIENINKILNDKKT